MSAHPGENGGKTGVFLVLEGTEGVGKSTNMDFICNWLDNAGIAHVRTREPGGTPLAETLREILLARREERFDPLAELLVVFAARAQHLAEVIKPALAQGIWVVCDRFTDATYAYQGGGRGLGMASIATLESLVQGALRPDAVLVLDVDPQTGLQRAGQRSAADRFESEALRFFERVREVYRQRVAADPGRYHLVDAGVPLDQVQAQLAGILAGLAARSVDGAVAIAGMTTCRDETEKPSAELGPVVAGPAQ